MARVTMKHGATMDVATVDEVRKLLAEQSGRDHRGRVRVRAEAVQHVGGDGNLLLDVYSVPVGFEFELRRIFFDLSETTSPATGNFLLNGANVALELLRSGNRIEYASPAPPQGGSTAQIPGVQTWGMEQGPYLVNGEVFQVLARSFPTNVTLIVRAEGILTRVRAQ